MDLKLTQRERELLLAILQNSATPNLSVAEELISLKQRILQNTAEVTEDAEDRN